MKPTQLALAAYLGKTAVGLSYKKKKNRKEYDLLMMGWKVYIEQLKQKEK